MAELIEYKCPCCAAKIEWDSNAQKMKCPFCDSEFSIEELQSYDDVLAEPETDTQNDPESEWAAGETEGMRIYSCKTCGGQVIADETTGASQCPYCGNPVIMAGNFSGDLRPDFVIPFKLDKEAAKKALTQHMEGKFLLPKVFKSQNHIDEIRGVYVPVWLFDADVDAAFRYEATKVRTWRDQQYEYTETSYYDVRRTGSMGFERVPVDGSTKMDDTFMESLEPFDFGQAVPFATAYLSGYLADRYDVTVEQSEPRAEDRIKESTRRSFLATVQGYSTVEPRQEQIGLKNRKSAYALYPVWMLGTSWNGNQYTFAMNGQSGKFVGNLPADKGKAWGMFFGVTVGAAILVYLITMALSETNQGNLLMAAIIALIIGGITMFSLLGQLKSVAAKNEASAYIRDEKVNVTQRDDRFVNTKTERRMLPQAREGGPGGPGAPGGGPRPGGGPTLQD